MKIVLSTYFLNGGLIFLVALLGWGDQIKDIRKTTREMMDKFSKKVKKNYKEIKKLVQQDATDTFSPVESFVNELKSVLEIIDNDQRRGEDLEYLNELTNVNKTVSFIAKQKEKIYVLIVELSLIFLGFGVIFLAIEPILEQFTFLLPVYYVLAFVPLLWIYKVFLLLIITNNLEKRLQRIIEKIDSLFSE